MSGARSGPAAERAGRETGRVGWMTRGGGSSPGLFAIGVAALFLAGFLLLVIFGAGTYQGTVARQDRNGETRAELAFFSALLKGGDLAGAVEVRDSGYGKVLVVGDGSGYAQRVFLFEGTLLEDYGPADASPDPQKAQPIGRTERFEIEEREGLLCIRTDAGQVLLHPRCG